MVEKPGRLVAHTPPPGGEWHYLDDHALAVAEKAAGFAEAFGARDIAWWLGLLHDAGKAHPDFQNYLLACAREPERKQPTVDHKSAGAFLLQSANDLPQVLLGHHGGLSDLGAVNAHLRDLIQKHQERMTAAWRRFQSLGLTMSNPPQPTPEWARESPLSHEFYLRMLFSCLVDADALDTEAHWNTDSSTIRHAETPSLQTLWTRFSANHSQLLAHVSESGLSNTPVNRVRADVYDACIRRASESPGFFRLTVPTGGGKTRSATAFALRHAITHNLNRVIFALPFLTITEQTVDVLRDAVGNDRAILEHHSGIDPGKDSATGVESADERWRQLASDNWDAPIVVTTTVQLFESLLGRRTRQCRKLHNIARSVIILDEFQTVPAHLRATIFDVLRELVTHYGVSVVLCTATQPVLDTIEGELAGLGIEVRELAPDPAHAFATLERVKYEWPAIGDTWTWERLADDIANHLQSLTIVNTVRDAAHLFLQLDDSEAFHLSTRMCGAHRRDVLRHIRSRLRNGEPCRVISTQLVEAGVDLDFPVVFRAIGPLDRIAQAAGRCNREGRLPGKGSVVVFSTPDDTMPPGAYRHGADITSGMLREGSIDFRDPNTFDAYFRRLYADQEADRWKIQSFRARREYEQVAEHFRIIDDDTFPVLVPYGDAHDARDALLDAARYPGRSLRDAFRAIQPFVVSCRTYERGRFEASGLITELRPGLWEWTGDYGRTGLAGDRINPERLFF